MLCSHPRLTISSKSLRSPKIIATVSVVMAAFAADALYLAAQSIKKQENEEVVGISTIRSLINK